MARLKIKIGGKRELRHKEAEVLIKKAALCAFEGVGCGFDASVDITMTGDEGIRALNAEYRDVDKVTDVLSFPLVDFYEGAYDGDINQECDPDSRSVPLGDMIMNVKRAREQADEYGHSFERECAYLTVHSILHLLGFDHEQSEQEKKNMRECEERIMSALRLER